MNKLSDAGKPKADSGGPEQAATKLITPVRKRGLLSRLRTYFFAGVLVTAPFGLTAWLVWLLVDFIDRTVIPLIPLGYNPSNILGHSIPGLGVIIVLVTMTLVGALVTNFLGRYMLRLGERVLNRLPVVRTVYGVFKQIFDAVLAQSANAFREVVLIEYPRKGIWVVGFVTGTTRGEVQRVIQDDMVNIFVPTTPNPTSGFLLFMPRKDCVSLVMSVEEGVKLVISGGIVSPPDPDAETSLADKESATTGVDHPARTD